MPPLLLAERLTELAEDMVVLCTGGTAGQTTTANFQFFPKCADHQSVSASSVPSNNPQQVAGYVQRGLQFAVTSKHGSGFAACAQCEAQNTQSQDTLTGGRATQFALRSNEGFHTAFKTHIMAGQTTSLPGAVYASEIRRGFLQRRWPRFRNRAQHPVRRGTPLCEHGGQRRNYAGFTVPGSSTFPAVEIPIVDGSATPQGN